MPCAQKGNIQTCHVEHPIRSEFSPHKCEVSSMNVSFLGNPLSFRCLFGLCNFDWCRTHLESRWKFDKCRILDHTKWDYILVAYVVKMAIAFSS